ncbi:unnamed protein product, partial [Rotaria sordida]
TIGIRTMITVTETERSSNYDEIHIEYLKYEYVLNFVNHGYEIDWLIELVVAQRHGVLEDSKIVGKRSLSLIPIQDWSWFFTESIFLRLPGVYNFMFAFTKNSALPKFRTLLKGRICKAQLYVKRISISQIPHKDEAKYGQWLHERFQEKDRIYDHFVRYDTFEGFGLLKVPSVRNYYDILIEVF